MSFDALHHLVPPESTFQVTLEKTAQGPGVSVTGGREARNHRLRGFAWIKKVFPMTLAWEQGILALGDTILKANEIPLIWLTTTLMVYCLPYHFSPLLSSSETDPLSLSLSQKQSPSGLLAVWDASTDSPTPEMFGSPPHPTSLDLASLSSWSSSLCRQQFIVPSLVLGDSPDQSLASLPPEIEPAKKFQRNHEYMSANWNERSRGGKTSDGDMGLLKWRGTVFNEPDDHNDRPNDAEEDVAEIGISPSDHGKTKTTVYKVHLDVVPTLSSDPKPQIITVLVNGEDVSGQETEAVIGLLHKLRGHIHMVLYRLQTGLHFVTFCTSAFHCVSSAMKIGIVFLLCPSDRPRIRPLKLNLATSKNIEINQIISSCYLVDGDLIEPNHRAFAAAITIHQKWQGPEKPTPKSGKGPSSIPPRKRRLQSRIDAARQDLSTLQEIKKGITSWKVKLTYRQLSPKYKITSEADLPTAIENVKMKIQVWVLRIRRYTKRVNYFRHNERFTNNQKLFYPELGVKSIEVKKIPGKAQLEEFWSKIMEYPVSHNVNAIWLQLQRESPDIPEMSDRQITASDLKKALKQTANSGARPSSELLAEAVDIAT
ncbi:unnamed protein product [Darwinula stevensoni]|uniref:PDZ domain-containing protein n=1 Tax=Darwinula stevensoni TaxID=69355 RepID=A0A7R9A5E2_9CRUS|nr:unnamed protein product [Darwinula stevensoni]CAG0895433.1 unnamed protein product [Darwinula stevensoni]